MTDPNVRAELDAYRAETSAYRAEATAFRNEVIAEIRSYRAEVVAWKEVNDERFARIEGTLMQIRERLDDDDE